MTDKIGTVRKMTKNSEVMYRFGIYKAVMTELDKRGVFKIADWANEEMYGGYVYDYAHLVVMGDGLGLPSANANTAELTDGFLKFYDTHPAELEQMRKLIKDAETESEKKDT